MRYYKTRYLLENENESILGNGFLRMHRLQNFIALLAECENKRLSRLSGKFAGGAKSTKPKELKDTVKVDICQNNLEYYFSEKNLPTDPFMTGLLKHNGGRVPMIALLRFPRLKKIECSPEIFKAAVEKSSELVLNPGGTAVQGVTKYESLTT